MMFMFLFFFASFLLFFLLWNNQIIINKKHTQNTGYILGTPVNKRIDIFYSLVGAALFIATGSLILQDWNGGLNEYLKTEAHKLAITKGSLAIVNGILFFADVIFTFRD